MANNLPWISVKDRLPDDEGPYPTCSTNPKRPPPSDWIDSLCAFNPKAGPNQSQWQHVSGFYDNGVTHWLELPPRPPLDEGET